MTSTPGDLERSSRACRSGWGGDEAVEVSGECAASKIRASSSHGAPPRVGDTCAARMIIGC